jgi:peptidoglycan/LPS O-acetylase OafA/YrhL
MRAFAVAVVFAFHAHLLPGGYLGVDVFFVLSGFLITTLLLDEWQATYSLNIPYFYLRRAARLMPALCVLLLVYVMLPLIRLRFPNAVPVASREVLYAFSYAMNWGLAFEQLGAPFLSHTWTLAIEEQFYLIWPVVLVMLLQWFHAGFLA